MANASTKNELKVLSIYNFIKEKPTSVPNYPHLLYIFTGQPGSLGLTEFLSCHLCPLSAFAPACALFNRHYLCETIETKGRDLATLCFNKNCTLS